MSEEKNKLIQESGSPLDTSVKKDSLLDALVFITAYFGHTRSAPSLVAGLPLDKSGLNPKLFCQAADRAGFKAKVLKRSLDDIPQEVLPVVIVNQDKSAKVLLKHENKNSLVIKDGISGEERSVSYSELNKGYSGYCIYIKPDHEIDDDAPLSWDNHWFWGNIKECSPIYLKVLIASVFINIFALTSPIFVMNFYDRVLPNNAIETGWVLAIGAGSVYIFDLIIRTLRSYFIDLAGRRSDVIIAQKLFNQVLDMRLACRKGSTGAFANNLKEFDALREFFNSATLTWLVDFPFSLLFVTVIWLIAGSSMAMLLVFLYLLVSVTGYFIQLPVRKKVYQAMKTGEMKHGLLVETISNLEMIKGIGGEGPLRASYAHYVAKSAEAGQQSRFYSGLSVNFAVFIQQLSNIIIVLLGMYMVEERTLTVGSLIACVILGSRAIMPVGQIAGLVNRYYQAKSAYRSLSSIMKQPIERPREKKFLHRPELKGNFSFQDVSFSYPGTAHPVLQDIKLHIKQGEKVAIAGRIGSGKSTLIKLMVDFFEPDSGSIMIDETDMRQIDPADLRRNIAYMGQDTSLMSGSVRENITMGASNASDEEVLKISELTGVHDFIRRHPMGYDALVGERGEGLSGGQRQSIALARTLIMDTPIIILDEPTNAMDTGTEDRILSNMQELVKDKTFVLVTHKPALLKLVDRLIVMDGGRVAIDGPRDQVLEALAKGQVKVEKS